MKALTDMENRIMASMRELQDTADAALTAVREANNRADALISALVGVRAQLAAYPLGMDQRAIDSLIATMNQTINAAREQAAQNDAAVVS